MAKIPQYHIQNLAQPITSNPGVDTSALRVGNDLLQNTSALASSEQQASNSMQAGIGQIFGAMAHGIALLAATKTAKNNIASVSNAHNYATDAAIDIHEAQKNAINTGMSAQPGTTDYNMRLNFNDKFKQIHDNYIKQYYTDSAGKTIDPVGKQKFETMLNDMRASNDEKVIDAEEKQTVVYSQSQFVATGANAAQKMAASNGDPSLLKTIGDEISSDEKLKLARMAFGDGADSHIQTVLNNVAQQGVAASMRINRDDSLAKGGDKKTGALQVEESQLWNSLAMAKDPTYAKYLTGEQLTKWQSDVQGKIKANHADQKQALNETLETQMTGITTQGLLAQESAFKGDITAFNQQVQELENQRSQITDKGDLATRKINSYSHAIAGARRVESEMAVAKTQQQNDQYQAQTQRVSEELSKPEVGAAMEEFYNAQRLLGDVSKTRGTPADFEKLVRVRDAAVKAQALGGFGLGVEGARYASKVMGDVNARLEVANQYAKKSAKVNDNEVAKWLDQASAMITNSQRAPEGVMNSLNPGRYQKFKLDIDSKWNNRLNDAVETARRTDSAFQTQYAVNPTAAVQSKADSIKTKFIEEYRKAHGMELNGVPPEHFAILAAPKIKKPVKPIPVRSQNGLVPPPPPYTPTITPGSPSTAGLDNGK